MRQNEECICPNCSSLARQRALFKYLQGKEDIDAPSFLIGKRTYIFVLSIINQKLHKRKRSLESLATYLYAIKEKNMLCLEIAPSLSPIRKVLKGVIYVSIDLEDPCAMFKMNLTDLIFKDFTFDLVICSHVLEHIKEDLIPIKEIYRVLKKNGTALFQIPIGYFEDPDGKCTEEFSERRFYGHVRSYGWDFDRRLTKVGFEVDIIDFKNAPSQLGIGKEVIFKCEKYEQGANNGESL
jgi:SAM-dependent methyltransferase